MNSTKVEFEPFEYSYYDYSDWYNAEPTKPPKDPANFLDQTQEKGLVMAVFGLVFSKLAMLVIAPDPLPFSKDTPADIKGGLGYVFGALLSFSHFGVLLWQKFDCPKTPEIYKYYALLASLPQLACLAYLCVQFALLFVKGPKTDESDLRVQAKKANMNFNNVKRNHDYCKQLVQSRHIDMCSYCSSSSTDKPTIVARILEVPKSYIYVPEKVFRFPIKLAVSAFVAFVAIYHAALLLIVLVVPTLHIVRAGIDENIAFLLLGFGIILSDDRMEVVRIVTFYTWLLEGTLTNSNTNLGSVSSQNERLILFFFFLVCYICAMTLSCLVSLVMLMKSMILHRSNLRGLYKGDVYSIYNSQKTIRPSKPGIVCWMGLTGYQAAIVCLGLAIQTVVFFICFLFLVFLIIIPVFYGRNIIVF
ncbi:Stimulated by retinoic acid gene 6 protein-like protein, partial [Nibea albiflora]